MVQNPLWNKQSTIREATKRSSMHGESTTSYTTAGDRLLRGINSQGDRPKQPTKCRVFDKTSGPTDLHEQDGVAWRSVTVMRVTHGVCTKCVRCEVCMVRGACTVCDVRMVHGVW